jgi:hypothetical protein
MRRAWLVLWLALLAGQLLALRHMAGRIAGDAPPYSAAMEAGLFALAVESREAWASLAGTVGADPGPADPPPGITADPLLRREEWLLRIRDIERRMHAAGSEARITEPLQAWLQAGRADPGNGLTDYLGALVQWLDASGEGEPGAAALERVALQPEAGSDFPAVSYEMSGPPAVLARQLHGQLRAHPRWQLSDLDLNHPPGAPFWWLRASARFLGTDRP